MSTDTRDSYGYFHHMQTRWNDNDVYGHVNNAVYYTWFDTLVNNFLIAHDLLVIGQSKTIGLVVDTRCQYYAPVSYPQSICAGLRGGKIGTSSVCYEIGLFVEDDDTPCASGHFVHVYVNEKTRKSTPISADMRAILERFV